MKMLGLRSREQTVILATALDEYARGCRGLMDHRVRARRRPEYGPCVEVAEALLKRVMALHYRLPRRPSRFCTHL